MPFERNFTRFLPIEKKLNVKIRSIYLFHPTSLVVTFKYVLSLQRLNFLSDLIFIVGNCLLERLYKFYNSFWVKKYSIGLWLGTLHATF